MKQNGRGIALEGEISRGHLIKHHAQGEQIGTGIQFLSPRLLGRHVGHGSHGGPGGGQQGLRQLGGHLGVRLGLLGQLGQSEIQHLGVSPIGDEDVGGFNVPMNDPFSMGGIQSVGHLDSQIQQLSGVKRPVGHPFLEGLTHQKLHDHEGLAVVISDVVNDADVGMIQCRGGPGFALEAFQGLVIPGQGLGQELHRHLAAQPGVFRPVDHAHSTPTQFFQDLIVGNGLTNHRAVPALFLDANPAGHREQSCSGRSMSGPPDSARSSRRAPPTFRTSTQQVSGSGRRARPPG